MAEPWFNPNMYGWIAGTLMGIIAGGIGGPLIGINVSKGQNQRLVIIFCYCIMICSIFLLGTGVVAFFSNQPFGVWYGLLLPGIMGSCIFGFFIPMIKKRYKTFEEAHIESQPPTTDN